MSGMEFMSEAIELAKDTEMGELLEQKEMLQGQLEAAQEAGNIEKSNFLSGELAKLDERMAQQPETLVGINREQLISFGEGYSGGHSESYWREKAGIEYVKHGKSRAYYRYVKRAGEAKAKDLE